MELLLLNCAKDGTKGDSEQPRGTLVILSDSTRTPFPLFQSSHYKVSREKRPGEFDVILQVL